MLWLNVNVKIGAVWSFLNLFSVKSANETILNLILSNTFLLISEISESIDNNTWEKLGDQHQYNEVEKVINCESTIWNSFFWSIFSIWLSNKAWHSSIVFPSLINVCDPAIPNWMASVIRKIFMIKDIVDDCEKINYAH